MLPSADDTHGACGARRDWHRNEVLVVESVTVPPAGSAIGAIVTLTSPAQYSHKALDAYQGEVPLFEPVELGTPARMRTSRRPLPRASRRFRSSDR